MKKVDLRLQLSGGCSISGVELSNDLKQLFEKHGFKDIRIKGLTEQDKYGWDGFTVDETIEIIFDLKQMTI